MSAPHETGRRGGSRMRLRGLIRKEFLQILRDPSSIAIAFLMPVALLLLFGYGVSLDARHVPVALVAEAPSPATAQFTAAFGHSDYFDARPMAGMRQAREALARGTIRGIVRIPADFAAEVDNPRQAHLQLIVNGVDGNTAGLVEGYVHGVWANWLAQRGTEQALPAQTPLRLDTRIWFNSELRSRNYLVPGLIAVIMTLIGALLTALVMAREWERGTMEALMITPVSMREIIVGKIVPYFVLGTGGMLLSVILALFLFQIPLRGSLAVLFMTSSLFLLAALGMGLLISVVARNQFVAGQLALVVTFLPAFLLSGFIFDIGSMPWVVRVITHLVAARYFVSILQTVFLAGDVWAVVLPNAAALALMAAAFLLVSRHKSRKRLE